MKKIILGIVGIVLIGGLIWFFVANQKTTEVTEDDTQSESSEVQDTGSTQGQESNSGLSESSDSITGNITAPSNSKSGDKPAGTDEDYAFDESDESDYSEPVDKEDFADFVNAALEELESDEVMATAIVSEMSKILEAQPALEEEGIRFYKKCTEKTKISEAVKGKCQEELKKRGAD